VSVVVVALVAAWSSACVVEDDDPPRGDDEDTTDGMSAAEECQAALESIGEVSCPPGLSFQFQSGGDPAEWDFVPLDEAPRIEFPNGYLIEASTETVFYGDLFVSNEQCIGGCFLTQAPGQSVCVGFDSEGNAACTSVGTTDAESCETLTETCAGG